MRRVQERKRRQTHLDFATAIAGEPNRRVPKRRKTRRNDVPKREIAKARASMLRWRIPAAALTNVFVMWKNFCHRPHRPSLTLNVSGMWKNYFRVPLSDVESSSEDDSPTNSESVSNNEQDKAAISIETSSESEAGDTPADSPALNQVRRKMLRQEYWRKKGTAFTLATVSGWLLASGLCVAAFIIWYLVSVYEAFYPTPIGNESGLAPQPLPQPVLADVVMFTTLLAICGAGSYVSWRITTKARKTAKSLHDVEPVTICNFPAEEVLVRAATEPSAPQETLLRAGQMSVETAPEQLLRVASGMVETQER